MNVTDMRFFDPGKPGWFLLIALFLGCIAAVLLIGKRRQKPRSEKGELQSVYAHMTRSLLDTTPDDRVVSAVITNLMEKLDPQHPDPLKTLPQLSHGRCAVYFVWMLCRETEQNGVTALQKSPARQFADMGIEGLQTIGAEATAAAARAYLYPAETDDGTDHAAAFSAACIEEQPLIRCREYIRTFPEEFLDE